MKAIRPPNRQLPALTCVQPRVTYWRCPLVPYWLLATANSRRLRAVFLRSDLPSTTQKLWPWSDMIDQATNMKHIMWHQREPQSLSSDSSERACKIKCKITTNFLLTTQMSICGLTASHVGCISNNIKRMKWDTQTMDSKRLGFHHHHKQNYDIWQGINAGQWYHKLHVMCFYYTSKT